MIDAVSNYKYLIMGIDADKHFNNDRYVDVYGFQADPSLLLNKCNAAVIMLRYGAGIKIKVLELLYLGIPCFCTSVASEGILSMEGLITNDDIDELSKKIIDMRNNAGFNKEAVRTRFISLYNLEKNKDRIDEIFNLGKRE
jgi:glycosyltransferase involved in cell wall biosynthesis